MKVSEILRRKGKRGKEIKDKIKRGKGEIEKKERLENNKNKLTQSEWKLDRREGE